MVEEDPRPRVTPKEEIWIVCKRLGEKHGIEPLEVLKRFVLVGMEVAKVEEFGGTVVARRNSKEVEIRVFKP
jgi:hypothetical protein